MSEQTQTETQQAPAQQPPNPDRFRLLPERPREQAPAQAQTQAPAEPPKEEPKTAADADDKVSKLQRRLADMERMQRKAEVSRRQELAELAELRELRRRVQEADPSVVDYDKLTERVLKDGPPKPEEIARTEAEKARAEVQKMREELEAERAQVRQTQLITNIKQAIDANEGFAFASWMGAAPALYERFEKFRTEHGECTADDQEAIASEFESELREKITEQIRSGAKRVPAVRKLISELAKELEASAPSETRPDQQVSGGQSRAAAPVQTPRTLTTSQGSEATERRTQVQSTRTVAERREAALARLRGLAQH